MTFGESYDGCMAQKHLPLLGEIFSRKTLSEAVTILHELHAALETAAGTNLTLADLAAAGASLGLSAEALEVVALLAAGGATIAAHLYLVEAISCMVRSVRIGGLIEQLASVPEGFIKNQIIAGVDDEATAVA